MRTCYTYENAGLNWRFGVLRNVIIALVLTLALTPMQLWTSVYRWNGNAGNNNWDDSRNWIDLNTSSQGVPGSGDTAIISGNAVVNVPASLANFEIENIFLRGTLNIAGSGSCSINVIDLTGTIDIQGARTTTIADSSFIQGTVKSKGDLTFQSNISLEGNFTFELDGTNNSFGNITGPHSLHLNYSTDSPRFSNPITVSNLTITSNANISQDSTAPIVITGTTTLTAGSGANDITLISPNNSFGTLTLTGNDVQITQNSDNLELGDIKANSLLLKINGTVTQSAGTSIRDALGGNNCRLQVQGAGPSLLSNSGNRVNTIAVDTTNAFSYSGESTLIVGELDLANTGTPITGIDTDGNLSFLNTSINTQRGMQIGGNLNIDDGILNGGSQTIEIKGNMTVSAPGVFRGDSGTVKFTQSNSILEANGSTFNNLEVVDSNLDIQNSDFTATGTVKVDSNNNPAQLQFIRGNHSAAIANLILDGNTAPVVDFANWNFNIGVSLDNEDGEIKLTGEQTTQTFAYDNANKLGLVSYYNGNGAGTIHHGDFWNLEIDAAGQTISLSSDISIHGFYNPNSNKTLSTPVSETDLVGLRLKDGTLNTADHTITLHGSYVRTDAALVSGNLRLTLLGNYPAYIGGNNDFFEFNCEDASVQGKIIYFQSGKTTRVANRFAIKGGGTHPPGNLLDIHSPVFPSPRSYIYVVSSQPGNAIHYWNFNRTSTAELELEFVYLLHSDASANPQIKPANATFQDCPEWHNPPYILLSWTKDIGDLDSAPVHNGRIDKILVDSEYNLNMDFNGLEVEVEGYEVRGFQAHGTNANQFYIKLEEQAYLDTSATPRWKIIRNDSLKDTVWGVKLRLYDRGENAANAKIYEKAYDDAAPIIGYTLAIASKKEIFVHFSESVVRSDSSSITMSDFNTTAGGGIAALRRVSNDTNGIRELILTTNNSISATDILNGITVNVDSGVRDIQTPKSTHDFDTTDSNDATDEILNSSHRISDVGLGVAGNGLMEPTTARSNVIPLSDNKLGIVSKFAWNDFLPSDSFSITAHRYTGISENPILVYSNSANADAKNGKLWLPAFGENASLPRNFSGLVPKPHTRTTTKSATTSSSDNYTYQFNMPDAMIENGKDLEFVFYFESSELYCAQILDDTASNWYRQVIPWAIKIQNIVAQAGSVSILNNILNPNNNDKTSLYYNLRTKGVVTIQVFDLSGDTVAVLQRGFQNTGKHSVSWNGRNGAGNPVARGIYFVRIVGPDKMDQIRKVLVIK